MTVHARAYRLGGGLRPQELRKRLAQANRGAVVQAAADDAADNELFVEMLAAQTLRAEASGSMLARKPEMDLLLRLAGTTQISRAVREKGAAEGRPYLLVVAGRRRPKGVRGLASVELPRRKLTRAELERVEKAALLNVEKS